MSTVNQNLVFNKPPRGVRKIIISTNIAETSITIDDVVYIIDSGRMKIRSYDPVNNIYTLNDDWVSLANAKQRRGRAGRVQSGECYHLFTRARERLLDRYPQPEMLRTRLDELILHIKFLQLGKVEPFLAKLMDAPNHKTVKSSLQHLRMLKALDANENLTPLGYHLAKLPLDPQIGKMILLGAIFSCIDPILSIAACLSEKDPFILRVGKEHEVSVIKRRLSKNSMSDHLIFAEIIARWEEAQNKKQFCREHFMSGNTLQTLSQLKMEFAQHLYEMGFLKSSYLKDKKANMNSHNKSLVKAIVCAGLYPNVVMVDYIERDLRTQSYRTVLSTPEDGFVKLDRVSVNSNATRYESPYLVYHEKHKNRNIFIHDSTMVSSLPLIIFGHKIKLQYSQIIVNDVFAFQCSRSLSKLLLQLRSEIQRILDSKIIAPGIIDWTSKTADTRILRGLVKFFRVEDTEMEVQRKTVFLKTKEKLRQEKHWEEPSRESKLPASYSVANVID